MSRLPTLSTDAAPGKAKQLLEGVQAKFKMTPNFTRVMANSPQLLEAYLGFNHALASGSIPPKLREEIAVEVAEQDGCEYCLSAHTALGKAVGLTDVELEEAREARSQFPKHRAALELARKIVNRRGHIEASDIEAARNAGFGDGEIAEIIGHVAINIFTNYFNTATEVEIDFPRVALHAK
jgi:uncharacterized peroxidase-related enzyme